MSDILRPSAPHMFRSKASSAGGDKSETFRVLKVLINLICPVKQLVAYRWTASSYNFKWSVFTGCGHVFAHPFFFWPRTHNFLFCSSPHTFIADVCDLNSCCFSSGCHLWTLSVISGRPTLWKCDTLVWKQCLIQQWHPDPNEVLLTQARPV